MKREEKNQQTKRRIMDNALAEFAKQGYGASSVNTICAAQNISKGIIYHYFKTKDELYLACVDECFELLTKHLECCITLNQGSVEEQLEEYFTVRMAFFRKNPIYQPIFCEAVISPPAHLISEIHVRKQAFHVIFSLFAQKLFDLKQTAKDISCFFLHLLIWLKHIRNHNWYQASCICCANSIIGILNHICTTHCCT